MRVTKVSIWRYSYSPRKTLWQPSDLPCVSSSSSPSLLGISCFGKSLTNMHGMSLRSGEPGYPPVVPRRAPMDKAAFARSPICLLFWVTLLYFSLSWIPAEIKGVEDFSRPVFNSAAIGTLPHPCSRSPFFFCCFGHWYLLFTFNKQSTGLACVKYFCWHLFIFDTATAEIRNLSDY